MNSDSEWYALYTRKGCEKKVARYLRKRKINYYCPLNYVAVKGFVKSTVIKQPLFPSYVFVFVEKSNHQDLKKIPGVTGFIYYLNKPAEFPNVEIELMRRFLNEHKAVQLKKTFLNYNETARHIFSSIKQRGNGKSPGGDKQMHLILPSLGCILISKDNDEVTSIVNEHTNQLNSNVVPRNVPTIIGNTL